MLLKSSKKPLQLRQAVIIVTLNPSPHSLRDVPHNWNVDDSR